MTAIDVSEYLNISQWAKLHEYSRQYVTDMIKVSRLDCVSLGDRGKLIHKTAVIKPAEKPRGRPVSK